jgi:hypothetical protein
MHSLTRPPPCSLSNEPAFKYSLSVVADRAPDAKVSPFPSPVFRRRRRLGRQNIFAAYRLSVSASITATISTRQLSCASCWRVRDPEKGRERAEREDS